MSKPTGTSAEILDLPSGGGSVYGAGAGFSVDLNTGTGTVSFDIVVPTGPNGITPQLKLGYATTFGDGPFGLGWSLGMTTITRKITPSADTPEPDSVGTYTLVGVGDLIDMGSGRYRPTVDTSGQLIIFAGGYWTLTDSQDNSYTLGKTLNAQISGPTNSPAVWLVDSLTDSQGNTIAFSWLEQDGGRLLETISWGTYKLLFSYENRPDWGVSGQFGAPIIAKTRCNLIELHVVTETQSLVRSWTLLYDDNQGRGRSQLSVIREQGHAADGSTLPAPDRSFAYTSPQTPAFTPITGWTSSIADPNTDLVDLNGDGLPDLLRLSGGQPTLRPNLGAGQFGYPRSFRGVPTTLALSSANVAFANMSGMGNVDLIVLNQNIAGYYPLSVPQDGSGPSVFGRPVTFANAPSISPADPRVRLLDLNGDGLTDVLFDTGRAWLAYLRENTNSWSAIPRVLPQSITPTVYLSDPHVYVADMTGDGLADIVRIDGGSVAYWPARADGGWGAQIAMTPSPHFNRNYDPARMNVVDIDGDGCADLVYVDAMSVTLWRNVGAAQLADPVVINFTPIAQPGTYRILDLLGIGAAGVLFELPQLRPGRIRQAFLDLSGGAKPYLLSSYANGPCLSTTITYRSSTSYAVADAQADAPWLTYHPFPVQCVARTDQTDQATKKTTSTVYTYHSGRYDPVSRAFLGFAKVECDQLGDANCPTLRTRTTFHIGLNPTNPTQPLFGDDALKQGALRGRVLSTATYGLDGGPLASNPYSVSLHSYDALLVTSGLDNTTKIAVPYMTSTTEQRWERQNTQVSTRLVQILAVNSEGDITLQRTQAQRVGVAAPDQDITTTTTFAIGGANLRLPARITQTGPDGSVTGASVTYYDGDPYIGLPEGQAALGLISRVEQLAFTDTFVASIWGASPPGFTQYGYHRLAGDNTGWWVTKSAYSRPKTATGQSLLIKGPMGGLQTLHYDAAVQRIIGVTDAAGNTMTATIDPRVWQTSSITDVNGHKAVDVFDALGRVTATIGPTDSAALPLFSYSYTVGAVSVIDAAARIAHAAAEVIHSLTWISGTGQPLGKAEPAAVAGQWIISGATSCNARGLASTAFLPYLAQADDVWHPPPTGTLFATTSYDALGRIVQLTRPDGLVVSTRREASTMIISEQWPNEANQDVERQVYDAAGQLISVSRNNAGQWIEQSYTYAPSGKVVSVALPSGPTATMRYDLLGRRFSYSSPDAGLTIYLLDASGALRLRTNAAGQQLRTEYDSANRVSNVFYDSEPTPRIAYQYLDQASPTPADGIVANRYGRIWNVSDELGSLTFQYDEMGRVISNTRTVTALAQSFNSSQTYDALGRTISLSLPPTTSGAAGRIVDYTYGLDGRVASASGVIAQASYDIFGRTTALTYANGAATQITYRPAGGGIARVLVADASGAALRDVSTSVTQAYIMGLSSAIALDDSVAFTYDGMRRLASARYATSTGQTENHSWSYDDEFRMTVNADAGALVYRPGTHQLQSVGGQVVGYDAAGRMSAGSYGKLTFDACDHLAAVNTSAADAISHIYDYGGRRARSLLNGVQSYLSPLKTFELRGQDMVAWIAFGSFTLAAEVNGTLWSLHANALGNTDLVTDSTGHFAFRLKQTPFGMTRPDMVTPSAGAASALASVMIGADSTGLICVGTRWYDPRLGQFISPDPLIPGVYLIGAWNPYIYCLGNPITLCDPSGCSFWSVLAMIGIAVVATALVLVGMYYAASLLGVAINASQALDTWAEIAIGTFGSSVSGEVAAQNAGGNIWAGAFVGALLGGVTSYAGAMMGTAAASSLNAGVTYNRTISFMISGLLQGESAGLGTGLAVGFAGGKGSLDSMLKATAQGALWGATLGGVIGLGLGFVVGGADPDKFINVFSFGEKFAKQGNPWTLYGDVDNWLNAGQSVVQMIIPGGGGLSTQNIGGFLTNFVSTGATKSGLFSISLDGVANVFLNDGALTAVVNVSMLTDQLGFTYAQQFVMLMGAAPVLDLFFAQWQLSDPSGLNSFQNNMDSFYGANDPAEPTKQSGILGSA
jgi:RHS repeat-associated protein